MTKVAKKITQLTRHCGSVVYRGTLKRLPLIGQRYLVHAVKHRRLLNLREPCTFNEKISWRMLFDRRDILAKTCDKKAMKWLAHERAGDLVRIPKTIWSGTDVKDLARIPLPQHWVLKPNHRSGLVYFGQGRADVEELASITRGWLDEVMWKDLGEWAYSQAEATLLVEELIGFPGTPPIDYKFQVFDGKVRLLLVYLGRFDDLRGYLFDRNFQRVEAQDASEVLRPEDVVQKPRNFERMLEAAERIAYGYDYLRVDLYDTGDEVWFGEVTPYEGGGAARFLPSSFDEELGSYWTLPQL